MWDCDYSCHRRTYFIVVYIDVINVVCVIFCVYVHVLVIDVEFEDKGTFEASHVFSLFRIELVLL